MKRWSVALALMAAGGLAGVWVPLAISQAQPPASASIPKEMSSYRDVVKKVLPAVVSVQSKPKVQTAKEKAAPRNRQVPDDLRRQVPEEFRKFFEGMEEGDMDPPQRASFGSGVIIDPKGVVLTNFHVVEGADRVKITLTDGREFTSTSVVGDKKADLALVRFDTKSPLPYLQFGDSEAMEIGDRVLAVGAPFGLAGSVTSGIVSAKARAGVNSDRSVYEDFLQTDAAINPGNSGGPLVNLDGQIIGINTAIKSRSGGFQGVGLAISSTVAKDVVDKLQRDGIVKRGYLGVSVGPLEPEVAGELGLPNATGLNVGKVFPGSPAAQAGVKAGDIITQVDGKSVKDGRDLQRIVGQLPLNQPVELKVFRNGKMQTVSVKVETQPATYGLVSGEVPQRGQPAKPADINVEKMGMEVADLTPEMARRYGFERGAKGVLITSVEDGGIASEAGLAKGMLITKIDQTPVASAEKARELLEKKTTKDRLLLQVEYPETFGGGTAYKVIKPGVAK